MSEAKSPQGGLTRRSFLKTTGAVGALGLAGAVGMTTAESWLAPAEANAEPEERYAYLCHQYHCLSGCCLKCTVRDGRIALIEPNDALEPQHRRICLRGISEVQHVYAKHRLQTPLKRVGERGEGKFVAVTWEEAIKEIADAIKESQAKYGDNSLFCRKSTEAWALGSEEFVVRMLHGDQGGNWGLDRGQPNGMNPAFGVGSYVPSRSIQEFKDAATIIELGHNPLESAMTWSGALMDAKEAGTYIIAMDPRFSGTASKADKWLPVKPGSDAAVITGMLKAVVDNKWYDEGFMKANTSFPFLVDTETGKSYRSADVMCPNPTVVGGETVGAPYVWDAASNSLKLYNEKGVDPVLEGTWTVGGVKVSTEFTLMKEWLAKYTIEWAAEMSGIDAEVILEIADRYANNGPAIIDFGLGGPDKYTNADVLGHASCILTALTGNYGKKGAGLGFYGGIGGYPAATLNTWPLPETCYYGDCGMGMYDMPYHENNIHVALTFGDCFTLEAAAANDMLEWVKSLDFFAVADIYHSSIVDYADIVLPVASKFESEEEVKHLRDSQGHVALSTKAIDPLFESKSDLYIERLIAEQWGLEDLLPKSYEERARFMLEGVGDLDESMKGITYESLLENQGVKMIPGCGELPDGHADQVYATPSTKIELYYEYLLDQGHQFPEYELPNEAYESNPLKEKYPLYFTQGKTRYRIHAYYSASSWFQENYGPCIDISPVDAEARGIKNGDDVRVFNDRGYFVCSARVNNSMQPGVLFMAETTYNSLYKEGFLQNVTNSARNERCYAMYHGPQIPYNDTLVQVEKA